MIRNCCDSRNDFHNLSSDAILESSVTSNVPLEDLQYQNRMSKSGMVVQTTLHAENTVQNPRVGLDRGGK